MGIFRNFLNKKTALEKYVDKIKESKENEPSAIKDFLDVLTDTVDGKNGIRGYVMNPLVKSFICPHCLKSILMEKITSITCPFCDIKSENKIGFFLVCPACHSKIKYFKCPYCDTDIDLDAPYNHKELEEKRNG